MIQDATQLDKPFLAHASYYMLFLPYIVVLFCLFGSNIVNGSTLLLATFARACMITDMERTITAGGIGCDWGGASIGAPLRYHLFCTETELVYRASRAAAPELHPTAQSGAFSSDLWRYHCAEFFLAAPEASPYLEFNLAPNGAWWACLFTAPRVAAVPAPDFSAIRASGNITPQGWEAELRLPLALLQSCGISLSACRLAIGAALPQNGHARWLTTMPHDPAAAPDFHTPAAWAHTAL